MPIERYESISLTDRCVWKKNISDYTCHFPNTNKIITRSSPNVHSSQPKFLTF